MNFSSTKDFILNIRETREPSIYLNHILEYPKIITELIHYSATDHNYPFQEYASWILVFVARQEPKLLKNHYQDFVEILLSVQNQSTLRNVTKVIEQIGIQKYKESELLNFLVGSIENNSNKVALQVYSMQILLQFLTLYPELKHEFTALIELHSTNKTPAYFAGMRFFIKNSKKIK